MSTDPDLCVVMETLDEYRNKLPEGTYVRVCASIKNLHNKLKKPRIVLPRFKEKIIPKYYIINTIFKYVISNHIRCTHIHVR